MSISFNFPHFTSGDPSITLQGDARISANGILALPNDPSIGWTTSRAWYGKPVPIWDSATGDVASFITSFDFVVNDFESYKPSDGFAFFLAPHGTQIPSNSDGGNLGLVNSSNALNQFVAVEFDTYSNIWDPNYSHIGIDVNSVISLKTVPWNRVSGSLEKVSIIYDSVTKTSSVAVTHQNGEISTISQVVNLKVVLPAKVSVGFAAITTQRFRERHDIHSWSFTSTLNTNGST